MLKRGVFSLAVVLLLATVSLGPAVPEADAQSFYFASVWVPCGDGLACYQRICELSTYFDCNGFIQCGC